MHVANSGSDAERNSRKSTARAWDRREAATRPLKLSGGLSGATLNDRRPDYLADDRRFTRRRSTAHRGRPASQPDYDEQKFESLTGISPAERIRMEPLGRPAAAPACDTCASSRTRRVSSALRRGSERGATPPIWRDRHPIIVLALAAVSRVQLRFSGTAGITPQSFEFINSGREHLAENAAQILSDRGINMTRMLPELADSTKIWDASRALSCRLAVSRRARRHGVREAATRAWSVVPT